MKTIHIEITDEPIEAGRPYTDKSTGMQKMIPSKQKAYLWSGAAYPMPFTLDVPEAGPRKPGLYMLTGSCFKPGQYGPEFRYRDIELVPLEEAAKELQSHVQKPRIAAAS